MKRLLLGWPLLPSAGAAQANPSFVSCSTGDAPVWYSSYACSDVCSAVPDFGGLDIITCDISGSEVDGEVHLVLDYAGASAITFSAWGTTEDDVDFCCFADDSGNQVYRSYLFGGGRSDIMSHQGGGASLDDPTSGAFAAEIWAGAGDDEVTGSTEQLAAFKDYLFAEGGSDTIWASRGADRCEGGAGADTIWSEGGDDIVRGAGGADYLSGAAGDNTLCGGNGSFTSGDYFVATAGTNDFWEAYSTIFAAPTGSVLGTSSACGHTSWGSSWVSGTCSYALTSEPSGCSGWW